MNQHLLLLALTRLAADQIQHATPAQIPGPTRIAIEQAAQLDHSQLAGNVRVLQIKMTDADTGIVSEVPMVVFYPPEQWCTTQEPRICP
jgi:hypothetical protein